MEKMLKGLFFILIYSILLSCGPSRENNFTSSKEAHRLKAFLVIDGTINDNSFNEGAWQGMLEAGKYMDYDIHYIANKEPSEYRSSFSFVDSQNPDIIIGVGYKLEEEIKNQAKENPDMTYVLIDATDLSLSLDNLYLISFATEEASFLAGYLAARTSSTGKIGFLGGVRSDIVDAFDYGFEAGALYADPEIQIIKQYAETFFDPSKGRTIAEFMIQNNVDIIAHAAGPTGNGMIEVIREHQLKKEDNSHNFWAIGVDIDQYSLAPEVMLTSIVKRVDKTVFGILKDFKAGRLEKGKNYLYGIKEDFVGLSDTTSYNADDLILKELRTISHKIKKQEIKVPYSKNLFR